jgi:hypothetical protein
MIGTINEYGAAGGMKIGKQNQSTRRKPAPVPHYTPKISCDLTLNPGSRGGKPTTNCLSYEMVIYERDPLQFNYINLP